MAKDSLNKEVLNTFLNLFGIGMSPKADEIVNQIYPTEPKNPSSINKNDLSNVEYQKVNFDDYLKKLLSWWATNTQSSKEDWQNRMNLWEDMYKLALNSPYVGRAIEIVADEVVQVDNGNEEVLKVEAKKDQKTFILDFLKRVNIYSKIRPTATNIAKYGNDLWVLGFDDTGVSDVIPITVRNFKDRLEFTPYKVEEELQGKNKTSSWSQFLKDYSSNVTRVDKLVKDITKKDNVANKYKSYLFGFVLGNNEAKESDVIPPWKGLHFRNYTSDEPFYPFGMPLFIYSLAPYNQLDAVKTMITIARGMMFPKHVYNIKTPTNASPSEQFQQATRISNLIQNSGLNGVRKEDNGLGSTVITIEGLYEFKVEDVNIDLGKMEDLDLYKDELIVSIFLPRNLVDPNDSGFGDSGVSLVEKWKPFARLIYRIQQIIMEQITQLIKIHMIQSRKFKLEDIDFTLSMPYPESQVNDELISNQRELLDLANDLIDAFSDKFLNGEPISDELMKVIYNKFLPYDSVTMDSWEKLLKKQKKDLEKEQDMEDINNESDMEEKINKIERLLKLEESLRSDGKSWVKIKESIKNNALFEKLEGNSTKEKLESYIFDFKQENIKENTMRGRHVYSSRNAIEGFDPADLVKYDKEILREKYKDKKHILELEENEKVTQYVFDKKAKKKTKKSKK
jgi:hypothetical protein